MATERNNRMKTKKKERVTNPYEEIKKDLEKQKEALLADAGVILGSGLNQGMKR